MNVTFHLVVLLLSIPIVVSVDQSVIADIQGLVVSVSTNPYLLAQDICKNSSDSCMYIAVNAIERKKSILLGEALEGWRLADQCHCMMPPRLAKLPLLQFLHIPKTGSSINWALAGYFDNCSETFSTLNPCPRHLTDVRCR